MTAELPKLPKQAELLQTPQKHSCIAAQKTNRKPLMQKTIFWVPPPFIEKAWRGL